MINTSPKKLHCIEGVLKNTHLKFERIYSGMVHTGFRILNNHYPDYFSDLTEGSYVVRLNNYSNTFKAGHVYKIKECIYNDDEEIEDLTVLCLETKALYTGAVSRFIPLDWFKEKKGHLPEWL